MPDASARLLATSMVYTNILSLSSLLLARSSLHCSVVSNTALHTESTPVCGLGGKATSTAGVHRGRRMTTVRPCLSVRGMTNSFPVASFAMSSHLISCGLYVFLLRRQGRRADDMA